VLARLVRDPDQEVAGAAVRTLSAHPTGETLVTLWTSLGSAEPAVRDRMLDVLATFDRASLSRLADQALASPVAGERTAGLAVMSRLDPDGAVPRLIDSLQDPAPEVRVEALSNLQAHPSTIAVDAVGERLRDPHVKVRSLAASVLDATPDDRVVPYLVEAASDSAEEVRGVARGAILSRRSASVARSLIGSLSVAAHRRAASDLLGAMSEESRDLLLDSVEAADRDVQKAIGECLAVAGQESWVVEQLEDRRPRRRRDAVLALGAMGSSQAVPALIGRLEDPDGGVRRQVARVLGEMGDARAVEPLRQAFVSDPDLTVVAEIEPALRRLAGGNAEGDQDGS
jgi:HEAT repeat protein